MRGRQWEKVIDLAAEWKEKGWTHVENMGLHSGLLSEEHGHYMRMRKLNGTAANERLSNGNERGVPKTHRSKFVKETMQRFKAVRCYKNPKCVHHSTKAASYVFRKF